MDVRWLLLLIMSLLCFYNAKYARGENLAEKVCLGTTQWLQTDNRTDDLRLQELRDRFTNCTYIKGNLEITFLDQKLDFDLSFLGTIQEVEGYVAIVATYATNIHLHNLRLIRGKKLHTHGKGHYSLFIALNFIPNNFQHGLTSLGFTSLREISKGDVYIMDNNMLCNYSINWNDLFPRPVKQKAVIGIRNAYPVNPNCGAAVCHSSCEPQGPPRGKKTTHCWGPGADQCQKLAREACAAHCTNGCYGDGYTCCNIECAAGCIGPTNKDCWACKNVLNDGQCINQCPRLNYYDPEQQKYVEDLVNGRLQFGAFCMTECPSYVIQEENACVTECRQGYYETEDNKKCLKCGDICPKICPGFGELDQSVNFTNYKHFENCTVIKNNLVFLQTTFSGDTHYGTKPVPISELEVFKNVREITGSLVVQMAPQELKNLRFLRNLRKVVGRGPYPRNFVQHSQGGIHIAATQIEELGLSSLKEIKNARVEVYFNQRLCLADTVNWEKIVQYEYKKEINVYRNKDPQKCKNEGFVCHEDCSSDGCWGRGPENCVTCKNYSYGNKCVPSCKSIPMLFDAGNKTCKDCHPQCKSGCTGEADTDCDAAGCKNVMHGNKCLITCPMDFYDNSGLCEACHKNCEGGCTGPNNNVGPGACKSCVLAELDEGDSDKVVRCLPKDAVCSDGFYTKAIPSNANRSDLKHLQGKQACEKCHWLCSTCIGPTAAIGKGCQACKYLVQEDFCVDNCTASSHYLDPTQKKTCLRCHKACNGCTGPGEDSCKMCHQVRVYPYGDEPDSKDLPDSRFNCTAKCPPDKKYNITRTIDSLTQVICVSDKHPVIAARLRARDQTRNIIAGCIAGGIFLIGIIVVACVLFRRQKSKEKTMAIAAKMTGFEDDMPLTPTEAKPDMSKLRLLKESELRKGQIIGSGAFGTVYKGVWIPEGENVKIPVAIKVLQEGTSPNLNQELLEEARVMSSVDHNCCVRLLAVCMTAQMMLVTQLMPLGCLLDYIRKNKDKIGSKPLLRWCTQIAKGMGYLEHRGIVHRDLAARNVLVQSPNLVKITDFGLAKLLDYKESEFHASGGKMPIKWLALECIQHRIFTHKSDVWSFGVTAWELFTYGEKPYENVKARDVPELLEKGERLAQPSICTIDVYMILIKCWMVDAESRPSFKELEAEFTKMCRDPGRYLVIKGDKLMRLPSEAHDPRDILRTMSVAGEGPEEVMEADDYLRPTHDLPADLSEEREEEDSLRSPTETSPLMRRPRAEYENTEEAVAAARAHEKRVSGEGGKQKRGRGDSAHSRYSSDPCKHLLPGQTHKEDADVPDHMAPPTPMEDGEKQMPQVDEDDYLQPKSSYPNAYLDLQAGPNNNENDVTDYLLPREETGKPEEKSSAPVTQSGLPAVMNPEYFDGVPQQQSPKTKKRQKGTIWEKEGT